MRIPAATYRLQINHEFTLHDARALVPYLADLGVSDLYLSPIFEARPGSPHGYDVTDPTRVRAAAGGADALAALADTARAHGMGILLDIVPNHMAASPLNPWWHDVLRRGRKSEYAGFFDIDWGTMQAPQRLRLPILGDTLDAVLARGEIDIDAGADEVVYFETRLPLAAASIGGDAADLRGADRLAAIRRILDRQHYELAFWRTASEAMNYRRFFDITDLAGVRVEDDAVFRATHTLIRSLAGSGTITGLRIDHIDGLRDPAGYLRRLRAWVRGPDGEPVYTVVEKILAREERLPEDWACEGTTGYEFLNLATGLLIDPDGYAALEHSYRRVTGETRSFGELVREKKLLVMERLFGSELNALARSLAAIASLETQAARAAVAELTASMGVYRTYIRGPAVRAEDRRRIEEAVADAQIRHPQLEPTLDVVQRLLLQEGGPPDDLLLDWIMRWQQFTGPVMAKGSEDTALYCHNVLLAANEVGSDPVRPAIAAAQLQDMLELRCTLSPLSLNATATHDTKRGEDTRARIAVLSEIAEEWRTQLRRWMRQGDEWKAEIVEDEDTAVPEADVDSLLYQTLVGAWPLTGADDVYVERIKAYMMKAVREAKEQTSWRRPDEDFEQALARFIDVLMQEVGRAGLVESIGVFADRLGPYGALNSIAQLLLKVCAPGIPDIYQGTELWSFTLVDPDNRRPVDYTRRRDMLAELAPLLDAPHATTVRTLLERWHDGRIKLLLTSATLRFRTRHADLFARGGFAALPATGERATHLVAFARTLGERTCILLLPRWTTRLSPGGVLPTGDTIWGDTRVPLPPSTARIWRNALTGEILETDGSLRAADAFRSIPFGLLEHG